MRPLLPEDALTGQVGRTAEKMRALALLGAGVGLSLNELARAADLDKAQMSRIVAGLSKRELIARAEGCSMLNHVHFEVAIPDSKAPIDSGGFVLDNDGNERLRKPRFCNIGEVAKDAVYRAGPCPRKPSE